MAENLSSKEFKRRMGWLKDAHDFHTEKVKKNLDLWWDFYRGRQWKDEKMRKQFEFHPIENMVFSNVSIIRPSINFQNPRVTVFPRKRPYTLPNGDVFDTVTAAMLFEVYLNYKIKRMRMKRQTDMALNDALYGYWGWMQIGYALETEVIEEKGEVIEVHELIRADEVYARRLSPNDIRIDVEGIDHQLEDSRRIWIRDIKTLDEVKKNPKYKNTERLKTNHYIQAGGKSDRSGFKSHSEFEGVGGEDDYGRVELWHMWDKTTHEITTLAEGHDKELFLGPWPYDIEGFPVESLYFNENPDDLLPLADIETYIDMQMELNKLKAMKMSHICNLSEEKYLSRENAMKPSEKRKIVGRGNNIADVKSDPHSAVVPLKKQNVSQDIYMTERNTKDSIMGIAGTARFEQGGAQKFDTATEPALINQGINVRRQERTAVIEDFYKRVITKVAHVTQQTLKNRVDVPMTRENVQRMQRFQQKIQNAGGDLPDILNNILGPDGQPIMPWFEMDAETIKGDYEFEIEIGSTTPRNKETRKRDVMMIANRAMQMPHLYNMHELEKQILEEFEFKDIEKILKTQEQIQQEQQGQQQAQQQAQQQESQMALQDRQIKSQTDLQKTQIKSETSLKLQEMKNEGQSKSTVLGAMFAGKGNGGGI